MTDLISRADAIEAIFRVGQEHVADDVLPLGAVLDYIDAIKEVEAVNPNPCEWRWKLCPNANQHFQRVGYDEPTQTETMPELRSEDGGDK